jgi:hypothetical protein
MLSGEGSTTINKTDIPSPLPRSNFQYWSSVRDSARTRLSLTGVVRSRWSGDRSLIDIKQAPPSSAHQPIEPGRRQAVARGWLVHDCWGCGSLSTKGQNSGRVETDVMLWTSPSPHKPSLASINICALAKKNIWLAGELPQRPPLCLLVTALCMSIDTNRGQARGKSCDRPPTRQLFVLQNMHVAAVASLCCQSFWADT